MRFRGLKRFKTIFLVKIKGSSMYPTMKDGSIWVCYMPNQLKIDDIVVVYSEKLNKYIVKRVVNFNRKGELFLKSDNRAINTVDSEKLGYIEQRFVAGRCCFRVL